VGEGRLLLFWPFIEGLRACPSVGLRAGQGGPGRACRRLVGMLRPDAARGRQRAPQRMGRLFRPQCGTRCGTRCRRRRQTPSNCSGNLAWLGACIGHLTRRATRQRPTRSSCGIPAASETPSAVLRQINPGLPTVPEAVVEPVHKAVHKAWALGEACPALLRQVHIYETSIISIACDTTIAS
jgi:hypothetical protein